jgi:hypothetical protein
MGMPATGLTGGEVVRTELVGELRTFPLLAGLDEDDIAGIANEFEEHVADVCDRILARGALAGGLVLVLDGQVALRLDGEERARVVSAAESLRSAEGWLPLPVRAPDPDAALLEPFAPADAAREVRLRERLARVEAELVVAA